MSFSFSRRRAMAVIGSLACSAHTVFAATSSALSGGSRSLTFAVRMPKHVTPKPPILFLMHGFGSDEQDLLPLADSLPPELLVISLRAPYLNQSGGYRWYEGTRRDGRIDGNGAQIAISRAAVEASIARLTAQYHADPKRIFVGGFSQGAIMTYALTLSHPDRYRGGIVMSGALLPAIAATLDPGLDRTHIEMFIGHGSADQTVPFAYADEAAMQLRAWRVPLKFERYPGQGHSVSDAEMADISSWLAPLLRV